MISFWKDEEEKENVTQEDETEEEGNGNLITEEDFKQEHADSEEELDSNKIEESIDTSNIKSEDVENDENRCQFVLYAYYFLRLWVKFHSNET